MTELPLPTAGFSHNAFRVRDIEKTVAFYRDVLGWAQLFDISLGGEQIEHATGVAGAEGRMMGGTLGGVRLEFAQLPGEPPSASPANGSVPIGFLSMSLTVDDVAALYRSVTALGIPHDGEPHEVAGHRVLVLRDPDNNAVQLIQYPDGAHG